MCIYPNFGLQYLQQNLLTGDTVHPSYVKECRRSVLWRLIRDVADCLSTGSAVYRVLNATYTNFCNWNDTHPHPLLTSAITSDCVVPFKSLSCTCKSEMTHFLNKTNKTNGIKNNALIPQSPQPPSPTHAIASFTLVACCTMSSSAPSPNRVVALRITFQPHQD